MSDQTNAVSVSVGIETKDKILFHFETFSLPYLSIVSMSQLITVNYTPQHNLPTSPILPNFLYIVQLGLTFTLGFTD